MVKLEEVDLCRDRKLLQTLGGHLEPILGNRDFSMFYQRREVSLTD